MRRLGGFACILLLLTVPLMLSGCWNARQEYVKDLALGQARHVPLIIYGTSWNDPHTMFASPMWVGFLNTGDNRITSVTFYVSDCGAKGINSHVTWLKLTGQFVPNKAYVLFPKWRVQYSQWISRDRAEAAAKASPHLVIRTVTLGYSDGRNVSYNKDVSQLFAAGISNFCFNEVF